MKLMNGNGNVMASYCDRVGLALGMMLILLISLIFNFQKCLT